MEKTLIKTLIGYRNGFAYYKIGKDVYRCDYADLDFESLRWFSTLAGMPINIKAYGPLYNEIGEEAEPLTLNF